MLASRPLITLLLIAMFLIGPFALTGGAQDEDGDAGNVVSYSDPAGDAGPLGFGAGEDVPTHQLFDHIDLREVVFGPERADHFPFTIQFNAWDETISRVMWTGSASGIDCWGTFDYGDPDYEYRLHIRSVGTASEEPDFLWDLRFRYANFTSRMFGGDWSDNLDATWDSETASISFAIPKGYVPVFENGRARIPGAGDTFTMNELDCRTDFGLYGQYSDSFDEAPVGYPLLHPTNRGVVRIGIGASPDEAQVTADQWRFPSEDSFIQTFPVTAGVQTILPVHLENTASERKLALLDATPPPDQNGWNISLTESVLLNAKQSRTVNLIVTPPTDAAMGSEVDVLVTARVAGESSESAAPVRFNVMPSLSEEHNTIHLHARELEVLWGPAAGTIYRPYEILASVLEDEEDWDATAIAPSTLSSVRDSSSLVPTGSPLRLDADGEAVLDLVVTGEGRLDIDLDLYIGNDWIYGISERYEAGTHTIVLPARFDSDLEMPLGTVLEVDLDLRQGDMQSETALDLEGTRITLPIQRASAGMNVTDGTFMPNIALARGEDRATYLNPEGVYTWDLVLANDGVQQDDIELHADTNSSGWKVDLHPGDLFRIPSGNSTPVGVSVQAPADAKEGDVAKIVIEARSRNEPAASATLEVRAIATGEIQIEDKHYLDQENQLEPLQEVGESPAVAGLLAVLLVGLIGCRRRRA